LSISVIAGAMVYCVPRPGWPFGKEKADEDYPGPYTHVECGFPSERPEPWDVMDGPLCWKEYAEDAEMPTETVYAYVPVELVRCLLLSHGGEVTDLASEPADTEPRPHR
jgi:hypothetical protein